MRRVGLFHGLLIATVLAPAGRSAATSDAGAPPVCAASTVVVRLGAPAEVPASIDGIVVRRTGAPALTSGEIRVDLVSGTTRTPIAIELDSLSATDVLVRPTLTLADGAVLEVGARECDDAAAPWRSSAITLTAARAAPADLGTLALGEPLLGPGRPFTMSWEYAASDDAVAWRSAYWAAVEVDGVASEVDRTSLGDFVAGGHIGSLSITCDGWSEGLVPDGAHTIRLAAGLWGRPASVFSLPVEVTVECPDPWPMGPIVGPDGCRDSGHYPDGAPAPASCPADAGPPRCGSPLDGGDSTPCAPDAGRGGGAMAGCSAAPSPTDSSLALLIGSALLLLARRGATRRRRPGA